MGLDADDADDGFKTWMGFRCLMRRKQVDSVHKARADGRHHLAKRLTALQLIAIGVGSTIGAGVYVLVGTVAREHSGPALTISFLIAGIAAAFSAFCYAELASRCPSAGSAYHYSYICVGEGVAWIIGWALVLEYTIGGATVARGISPNLALFFGEGSNLPFFLGRVYIPWLNVVADPCAALLVLIVTCLLCLGIKESSLVQAIVTTANVCVLAFVIIAGAYLGFRNGWPGYEIPSGYFPFGVKGMLAGSATVFFAYIGFDTVASTAEEVKTPHRDLPLGIGVAVFICCSLYMLVSIVVVGLIPYYAMDPDTPISSAFATYKMHWVMYIITAGAVMALCSTLMGSLLPQPRVLMAMARDGLLPSFFADINKHTHVPVNSTIVTGIFASLLTFFMDVSQLAGMVSVGTLLAFTIVAVSILILRYVPPDEVPMQASFQEPTNSASHQYGSSSSGDKKSTKDPGVCLSDSDRYLLGQSESSVEHPLISKMIDQERSNEQKRRRIAAWNIALACIGVLLLTSASLSEYLPGNWCFASFVRPNCAIHDRPRCGKAQFWTCWRIHLPLRSIPARCLHSHKCLLADESRLWNMDPRFCMVDRWGFNLFILRPEPQLATKCSLCAHCPCRGDLQKVVRICRLKTQGWEEGEWPAPFNVKDMMDVIIY